MRPDLQLFHKLGRSRFDLCLYPFAELCVAHVPEVGATELPAVRDRVRARAGGKRVLFNTVAGGVVEIGFECARVCSWISLQTPVPANVSSRERNVQLLELAQRLDVAGTVFKVGNLFRGVYDLDIDRGNGLGRLAGNGPLESPVFSLARGYGRPYRLAGWVGSCGCVGGYDESDSLLGLHWHWKGLWDGEEAGVS